MPIIQDTSHVKTTYLGIKKMTFTNLQGYEVKQFCFTKYDKATQTNVVAGQYFRGHLTDINLDPIKEVTGKDGIKFQVQDLKLEFYDAANETKEVITFNMLNSFAEALVSKLSRAKDMTKIGIRFGESKVTDKNGQPILLPSGEQKLSPWIAVYEGNKKLDHTILPSYATGQGDEIHLPEKIYISKKGGKTADYKQALISGNKAVVDPEWIETASAIYIKALADISNVVLAQRGNVPEPVIEEEVGLTEADLIADEESVIMPY
jgi:hypothetical protein